MLILAPVLICVAVLAAPTAAEARTWRGETEQGRVVSVRTGADDLVNQVRVGWRAPCRKGHYVSRTLFVPPLDVSKLERFEHAGRYRSRLKNGYRARHTVLVRGRLGARDRWTGTFRVRTRVRKDGRVVDRCRLDGVSWSAEGS